MVGFKLFAMSKSEENEIWVALIEKAWAKVDGNCIRIGCGGSPNEVFDVLTEAYIEEVTVKTASKDAIWEKLVDGQKKGFVMTAGTSASEDVEDVGLSPGHYFYLNNFSHLKMINFLYYYFFHEIKFHYYYKYYLYHCYHLLREKLRHHMKNMTLCQ